MNAINTHELAAEIAAVQSALATGELTSFTAQEELNLLRRKVMGLANGEVEPDVLMGYRADAVEQGRMLSRLISDQDLHTAPDMTLFHLSACAEMFAGKVHHYFKLRNHRAGESLRAEEVNHG